MRPRLPIGVQLEDMVDYLRLRMLARQERDVPVATWSPWRDDRARP